MKISKTQWRPAEFYGFPRWYLDIWFDAGYLQRRRTSTDGGETWIYCYRGKV